MRARSVYASFSRRALARFIDLLVVLAPCGIVYLVNRAFGVPVRYTFFFNCQRPETATMFMTYDFPGFLAIFIGIKLVSQRLTAMCGAKGADAMRLLICILVSLRSSSL